MVGTAQIQPHCIGTSQLAGRQPPLTVHHKHAQGCWGGARQAHQVGYPASNKTGTKHSSNLDANAHCAGRARPGRRPPAPPGPAAGARWCRCPGCGRRQSPAVGKNKRQMRISRVKEPAGVWASAEPSRSGRGANLHESDQYSTVYSTQPAKGLAGIAVMAEGARRKQKATEKEATCPLHQTKCHQGGSKSQPCFRSPRAAAELPHAWEQCSLIAATESRAVACGRHSRHFVWTHRPAVGGYLPT